MSATEPLDLAAAFPTPSRHDWLDKVAAVLARGRGDLDAAEFERAFHRTLVHGLDGGIEIQPLYTADDAPPALGLPGTAPFVRGTRAAPRPWEIRQRIGVGSGSALEELESGATGLLVAVTSPADVDGLSTLLNGVMLDLAPVSLAVSGAARPSSAARALISFWESAGLDAAQRQGSLGLDPIGRHALSGGASDDLAELGALAGFVGEARSGAPGVVGFVADGTVWHDAGATEVDELAWATATGAYYARALAAAGTPIGDALTAVEFRFAATADQFTTIAKLRAARRLWARVAEIVGAAPDEGAQRQHAETARTMFTRYDPWVNVLRSTVACFAAGVGGADAVTVLPHDWLATPGGSALGRRLARNTQSILQMESNLSRVADLAGGSWYVESLTDELAERAWEQVRSTEALGGIVEALHAGAVHHRLGPAVEARRRSVATRRRPLTGTTEFPDLAEVVPPPSGFGRVVPVDGVEVAFEPLGLVRLADRIEAQRSRADRHLEQTGARPVVRLVTIGPASVHTTRLTFARNLFGVGGIETLDGPLGADGRMPPVVCLCSSDAVYADDGEDAARAAREAGARFVFVAGRRLDLDGVDEEVGLGSDVLDVIARTLDLLGVAP